MQPGQALRIDVPLEAIGRESSRPRAPANTNAASSNASSPAGNPPAFRAAQKIIAPIATLRTEAAAAPPIAEMPCSLDPQPTRRTKRRLQRRGETRPDGDSSARPARSRSFEKCQPPIRDRLSSAKISYLTFIGYYRLGNIDAIQLRPQETDAHRSVGIGMARSNVISKAFAYAKFFSRSYPRLRR